jgi:16S rRNA (cytosine967-C5)-methyltransferase
VNAVLRRVAEDSAAENRVPRAEGQGPSPQSLADRYSHPLWLVERWVHRFGPEETERLLQWNNQRPELVLQPARWTLEQLEAALRDAGTETRRAPWDAGLIVPRRSSPPTALPGYREGGFVVQDPAQAMVLRFLAPSEGALVYDACAAPGGKAVGLARTAGLVVAGDRSSARARRLATNLRRASPGSAHAVVADVRAPPVRPCDIVVLDVPCLGTGVLARNPDARWRVTPEALSSLAAQAGELLGTAAEVVGAGGRLLFATCSLEPEENEDQVEAFLARDPRFRREPADSVDSTLLTPAGDLSILPQRHGLDGAFAARLRKADG